MSNKSTNQIPIFSPADFVASLNQTLQYAYSQVVVEGELSDFRISKGRWVYFNIIDDIASVACFCTTYQLPGPLEDGMQVRVFAQPQLHQKYGFSLNVSQIQPIGEGTLRKAADLLYKKLQAEGLFSLERKRNLPYAPEHIGLITAINSAAYHDFVKILDERWGGTEVSVADSLVQGSNAPESLVTSLIRLNQLDKPPEVIVITRGGGSLEDLAAFNDERLVRAISSSRTPTLLAIGHESDYCLSELAADMRASTPSNAVQLLVPDKNYTLAKIKDNLISTELNLISKIKLFQENSNSIINQIDDILQFKFSAYDSRIQHTKKLINSLSPETALLRGYTMTRLGGRLVKSTTMIRAKDQISIQFWDGTVKTKVESVNHAKKANK